MPARPKETEARIAKRRVQGRWIARCLRLVGATLRLSLSDPHRILTDLPRPHLFAHWHNCLALSPIAYRRYLGWDRRLTAMISASGDGETLAAAMAVFRIEAARGSRSRGGMEALRTCLRALESGSDVVVTPDGPRGPCYIPQPGIATLARLAQKPVVPVRFIPRRAIRLKTWDRFQVPLPFSRCHIELGPALDPPPEEGDAPFLAKLQEILTPHGAPGAPVT